MEGFLKSMQYKKRICLGLDCNKMVLGDETYRFCLKCRANRKKFMDAYSESDNNPSVTAQEKRFKESKTILEKWRNC